MNTGYIKPTVYCGKEFQYDYYAPKRKCIKDYYQCSECKEKQRIQRARAEQQRQAQQLLFQQAEKPESDCLAVQTLLRNVIQTTTRQPIHLITQTAALLQSNTTINPVGGSSSTSSGNDEMRTLLQKEIRAVSSAVTTDEQPIDVVVTVTERAIAQRQPTQRRYKSVVITKNTIEKVIALKSVQNVPFHHPSYESYAVHNLTRMELLEKQLAEMQLFERETLLTNAETQHMRAMLDETSVEVLQRCTDQVKSTVLQYHNRVHSVRQQQSRQRNELKARSTALTEKETALQRELDAVRSEKTQIDEKLRVMTEEMQPMDQLLSETEKRLTEFTISIKQDLQHIISIHTKFRDEWRQRLQKNGQLLEKANSIARSLQKEVTVLVPEVIAEIDVALEFHTSHLEKLNEDLLSSVEDEFDAKQSDKQSIEKERQELISKRAQIIAKYPNAAAVVENTTSSSTSSKDTDGDLCVICIECSPAMACIPCGHYCVCEQCAQSLMQKQPVSCPVCRQRGVQLLKIYRPG